ncbi:GNAT family N-acetyltransferase [Rhodoferax aquaticus]|uniref:N-acetyltransferase n=1 Tax=Rhodoferax aquaticus TaxID=2527691 RepID=A0A515EKI1_9BURK|nr:GNAT family N-acetyltransferase [Rhodoferax aquaticus]QDL53175.1 N-acetyltransferase [Rhodoferax aquaticus]
MDGLSVLEPHTIHRLSSPQASDLQTIHAVQMLAYQQEAQLLGAQDFPPLRSTVEDLAQSGQLFWVARIASQTVGAMRLEVDAQAQTVCIASLVVHPQAQRSGIGHGLLGAALAYAPNYVFEVQTGAANAPALALYARCGFKEIHRHCVGPERLELVRLRLR